MPQPDRVLLVEDDPVSADYLIQLLQGLGLEVAHASRIPQAEALLGEPGARFALALVDQHLGGVRGECMLRVPNRPPMLAISAELPMEEAQRLRTAGFSACLRKPLDSLALASALRELGLQIPDWDERRGLEVAAGDPVVLQGLRGLLRRDLPQRRQALHSALEGGDIAAARAELHTLLGSCRLTGALRLELACLALADALDRAEHLQAWEALDAALRALIQDPAQAPNREPM